MVFKNKKQTKAIGRNKVFPIIFLKFFFSFWNNFFKTTDRLKNKIKFNQKFKKLLSKQRIIKISLIQ